MDDEREAGGDEYEPESFGDLDSGGSVGERSSPKAGQTRGVFLIIGAIVCVLVLAMVADRRDHGRTDLQIPSDNPVPISMNFFGCRDHDYFKRMQDYKDENDREAFGKAYFTGLATGQCITLKAGMPVYVEDRSFLSGLIQVRPQGSTHLVWTQPSAVGMQ